MADFGLARVYPKITDARSFSSVQGSLLQADAYSLYTQCKQLSLWDVYYNLQTLNSVRMVKKHWTGAGTFQNGLWAC